MIDETLVELRKTWRRQWGEYVQPALWLHQTTPDPRLPGKAAPFLLVFGRGCSTQIDATTPSPDDEGVEGLYDLIHDKSEALYLVRTFTTTCSIAMSRDDSDESTRTMESDALLPEPESNRVPWFW